MKIKLNPRRHLAGFMGIIIGILVLAVGGIVIYKLYQLAKHVLPPTPIDDSTNNVASTYYTYGGDRAASVSPKTPTRSDQLYLVSPTPVNSFTFQYRVMPDSNSLSATLVAGTNLMDGQVTELINNAAEYKISFIVGSQIYVEDYDAVTGDTISEDISPAYTGNPCSVIVERMTTYIWENIGTNYPCSVGTVYTFSDNNPPSGHAVYRLAITQ